MRSKYYFLSPCPTIFPFLDESLSLRADNEGKCESAAASIYAKEICETKFLCENISIRLLKQNKFVL